MRRSHLQLRRLARRGITRRPRLRGGDGSAKREVRLAGGNTLPYDRADRFAGHRFHVRHDSGAQQRGRAKPRPARVEGRPADAGAAQAARIDARRRCLRASQIPKAPYRCPPGPYERICQVADYFKKAKPKSKILVLDVNQDIVSKKGLFLAAWNGQYKGMIEYRPNSELVDVDVKDADGQAAVRGRQGRRAQRRAAAEVPARSPSRPASLPPTTAGAASTGRRCESTAVKGVHVLGDATLSAPAMPKSGEHGQPACQGLRGRGRRADQGPAGQCRSR